MPQSRRAKHDKIFPCPFVGEWLSCGSGSNRGGVTYGDYAFGMD